MNLRFQLLKFVGIFTLAFIGLYFLTHSSDGLQKNMAKVNAGLCEVIFNALNPDLSVELKPEAPPNPKGFDFTILIFDDRTDKEGPTTGVYQNHFLLFVIPFILLSAFFIASWDQVL